MNTITRPFNLEFTEEELETIAEALGEYILHDDPDADPDDLIGGIPVADRCNSIQRKISQAFWVRDDRPTDVTDCEERVKTSHLHPFYPLQ